MMFQAQHLGLGSQWLDSLTATSPMAPRPTECAPMVFTRTEKVHSWLSTDTGNSLVNICRSSLSMIPAQTQLDGPVRDQNGDPVRGNLHVWYTSIKAAQEARVRVMSLEFEYDPFSDSPDKLLLYLDEGDDVPIFRHHEPFVNLIELDQNSISRRTGSAMLLPGRCQTPSHCLTLNIFPCAHLTSRENQAQPWLPLR